MKTNRMFTAVRLMVLGVLVAGFNAKPANAQAFEGKFTLASAIRWGQATLPAGSYSFSLDYAHPGSVVTLRRGRKNVARIQTRGVSDFASGRSEIVVEGGIVSAMNLPQIGVKLEYATPKSAHRAAPQEPLAAQIIPVAAKGAGR